VPRALPRFFAYLIISILAHPFLAFAEQCGDDFNKIQCGSASGGGGVKTIQRSAGANSTFADGFKMNPGVLPTEPSGYGLETIVNSLRSDKRQIKPDFALIKGFHKIGTGISTAGQNTFYSNDLLQRAYGTPEAQTLQPLEKPQGKFSNLNVGVAFQIPPATRRLTTTLGLSARYNKTTNTFGGGPGLAMSLGFLTFGVGSTREKVSNYWAPAYFLTAMMSVRIFFLELEYNHLKNIGAISLDPVDIFTATLTIKGLLLTAAVRHLSYQGTGEVVQQHFAVQYLWNKHLSTGLLYNYIPGASSLALQLYL
jgi:hypothetical protein